MLESLNEESRPLLLPEPDQLEPSDAEGQPPVAKSSRWVAPKGFIWIETGK